MKGLILIRLYHALLLTRTSTFSTLINIKTRILKENDVFASLIKPFSYQSVTIQSLISTFQ